MAIRTSNPAHERSHRAKHPRSSKLDAKVSRSFAFHLVVPTPATVRRTFTVTDKFAGPGPV
jgi:hypothetical protein